MVQLVKRGEVKPQLQCHVNQNIQGLRKKRVAFGAKPSTHRWYHPFATLERNGQINLMITRNFVRFVFPMVPMFFFFYLGQPVIHGNIYIKHYNNFQWDALYFKFSMNRPLFTDQTITRWS